MLPFSGCLLSWKSFIIHVTFLGVLSELERRILPMLPFSGCLLSWSLLLSMFPFSGCLLSWKSFIIHLTFLGVLIKLEVFYYPCYLSRAAV